MFKNKAGQFRAGWVILTAFLIISFIEMIFTIPGFVTFGMIFGLEALELPTTGLMALMETKPWLFLFIQGGGTLGALLATMGVWRYMNKKSLRELGVRGSLTDLGFGLLLGALSITLIFVILLLTGNITLVNSFLTPNWSVYLVTYLLLFIAVGFFEEFFFRGYVMTVMQERGNPKWLLYVGSAVIFSLAHAANPNVSVLGLLNIALVGLLFAYMFDVTKSLWLPIGYHITWNYFQGNIFGFAVSGLAPHGLYEIDGSQGYELLTGGAFGIEGGLLATGFILLGFIVTKGYHQVKHREFQGRIDL